MTATEAVALILFLYGVALLGLIAALVWTAVVLVDARSHWNDER